MPTQSEPNDPFAGFDLFQREEEERRLERRQEARRNAEAQRAAEEEKLEALRVSAAAFQQRANAAILIRDYHAAGVEPPNLDADGVPTASLGMLLKVGWRLEPAEYGEVRLVPPGNFKSDDEGERDYGTND